MGIRLGPGIGLALAALVAACTTAPPRAPTPADPAAVCLAELDQRQIVYDRVKDWQNSNGCGIQSAVRVRRSATEWNHPGLVTCSFATRLWDFETQVVQPAALRLLGHGVREMINAGSYDCRGERSSRPDRLSQHAFGRALDVTGFRLDDGTRVSVLRDWRGQGAKSEFLHEVAKGACKIFSVVMTPNGNALHRDHLHLDIGPYRHCGY